MEARRMDQQEMIALEAWVTTALAKSSMGFRAAPARGWGIRRMLAEQDAPMASKGKKLYNNAYVVLENQLLNKDGQGVYIANPFYHVPLNISGIGKPGYNGPDVALDIQKYQDNSGDLNFKTRRQEHPEVDIKVADVATAKIYALMPGDVGRMKTPSVDDKSVPNYLLWGAQHLSRGALLASTAQVADFYGVCDNFTCATVAMVVNQDSFFLNDASMPVKNPILPGTTIELVELEPGNKKLKHILCVVNRDPSKTFKEYENWGDACFVIDHWYGLQRCTQGTAVQSVYWTRKIGTDTAEADYFSFYQGVKQAVPVTFTAASMKGVIPPKLCDVGAQKV